MVGAGLKRTEPEQKWPDEAGSSASASRRTAVSGRARHEHLMNVHAAYPPGRSTRICTVPGDVARVLQGHCFDLNSSPSPELLLR